MRHPDALPGASAETVDRQADLVRSLCSPAVYGVGIEGVALLETHISYVLLTGPFAYKIKKAVNLGFLDFTTLPARHFYCEEELRLNRRLAPGLYLDVVTIAGTVDHPAIGGEGPVLEYAVKMRQFPQDALLSRMLARGTLTADHIDALAAKVAAFHGVIQVASDRRPFGLPSDILHLALQNFAQTRPLIREASRRHDLDALSHWTSQEFSGRMALLAERRRHGFVRECHGDLHVGNIALVDDEVTIFDGIEFNDEMRWIDVMSEVAFAVMDLQDRKRSDWAFRFLNEYLEATGDYGGVRVLPFYLAYRAMVRAKIAAVRTAQLGPGRASGALMDEYDGYVNLAKAYALPPRPAIIITHGVAASGKTTLSRTLSEQIGAVRIRTDVERKRLHGLSGRARTGAPVGRGIYAPAATEAAYRHIRRLAGDIAKAGYVAIVDGAFLKRWQRDLFGNLASKLGIPFVIVSCHAAKDAVRERVLRRERSGSDASEADVAVLDHQWRTEEPLATEEQAVALTYEGDAALDAMRSAAFRHGVLERLGRSPRS